MIFSTDHRRKISFWLGGGAGQMFLRLSPRISLIVINLVINLKGYVYLNDK